MTECVTILVTGLFCDKTTSSKKRIRSCILAQKSHQMGLCIS